MLSPTRPAHQPAPPPFRRRHGIALQPADPDHAGPGIEIGDQPQQPAFADTGHPGQDNAFPRRDGKVRSPPHPVGGQTRRYQRIAGW